MIEMQQINNTTSIYIVTAPILGVIYLCFDSNIDSTVVRTLH